LWNRQGAKTPRKRIYYGLSWRLGALAPWRFDEFFALVVHSVSPLYDTAAEADITGVENDGLAWADGALRHGEAHFATIPVEPFDGAVLILLTVADAGAAGEGCLRRAAADPVQLACAQ